MNYIDKTLLLRELRIRKGVLAGSSEEGEAGTAVNEALEVYKEVLQERGEWPLK